MTDWKNIHPEFTKKLQKRWEGFGFIYEQVEELINDYGFSPQDADFAAYIGDNDLIEDLTELREKYDEAVKNKEIDFSFEEESEEEEVVVSNEKKWNNIRHNFSPKLIQWWQKYGFSYEETQEWINIGMGIFDVEFCAWLRDVKGASAEWVLNHGNVEQLRSERQQYYSLTDQQVQVS